jgi:hypothetical protein
MLDEVLGQRIIAEMVQQGNGPEAIAARMKEALSQVRHPKAERPVFTPEFLARIKRITVFNPLERAAMEGIARKAARVPGHAAGPARGLCGAGLALPRQDRPAAHDHPDLTPGAGRPLAT